MVSDAVESGAVEQPAARRGESAAARASALARAGIGSWDGPAVPVALYLLAVALLGFRIGSHPAFAYNWESYTARDLFAFWDHPSRAIFRLTDGLMTDSGRSPVIALPAWLGFKLLGPSLTALRLPNLLIGAWAVPLSWLVGKRFVEAGTATLGAVLLALSPVYLLYGRTATLVGVSLVPALLTIYALLRVLSRPADWRWLVALQALLLGDAYAYAPIRFLWPIALLLFAGELFWRRGRRRGFLVALVVTAIVLPLGLVVADRTLGYAGWDPVGSPLMRYYYGRGEQVVALRNDPQGYQFYLQLTPQEQAEHEVTGTAAQLALRLVRQNAVDLARLLGDSRTRPAITDYWNPQGRLYPWFLVPFFVLGCLVALWRARRRVEDRAWLALFWGFSLPLLLTSRVHIGRLIFDVPLLFLFVALGLASMARAAVWLRRRGGEVARRRGCGSGEARRALTVANGVAGGGKVAKRQGEHGGLPLPSSSPPLRLSASPRGRLAVLVVLALLSVVARSTWVDYRIEPPQAREVPITAALAGQAGAARASGGGVALVLASDPSQFDGDALTIGVVRLSLDGDYRFVDLSPGKAVPPPPAGDQRPPLYYGGLLFGRLTKPTTMPTFCQNIYVVAADNVSRFRSLTDQAAASSCDAPLRMVALPT